MQAPAKVGALAGAAIDRRMAGQAAVLFAALLARPSLNPALAGNGDAARDLAPDWRRVGLSAWGPGLMPCHGRRRPAALRPWQGWLVAGGWWLVVNSSLRLAGP